MSGDQKQLLAQIQRDTYKDLEEMNDARQGLLYNGSLLEYGNSRGPWGDLNPIVADLLTHYGD